MSAYMCSDDHIIAVALQSITKTNFHGTLIEEVDRAELQRRVTVLEAANIQSLCARYGDDAVEPRVDVGGDARIFDRVVMTKQDGDSDPVGRRMSALLDDLGQMATFVGCFEYQACEYSGWEESDAHAICAEAYRNIARGIPSDHASWGTYS